MSASSDSEWECPAEDRLFDDDEPEEVGNPTAENLSLPTLSVDARETFTFGAHSIILVHQGQSQSNAVGAKLWLGAMVCAQGLLNGVVALEGKSVLELGAGVGICGILASQLGAKQVILTDCCYTSLKGLLPNVLANCSEQPAVGSASWGVDCDRMCIRRHLWDNDLPRSPGRPLPQHWSNVPSCDFGHEGTPPELPADSFFDVVIGSDLLYFEPQVATLLATLSTRIKQGGHGLLALSVRKLSLYEHFLAGIPHVGLMLVSKGEVPVDDQGRSHALSVFGQDVQLVHLTKL